MEIKSPFIPKVEKGGWDRGPEEKVKRVWFSLLKGGKTIRLWEKQTTGRSGIRGNKKKMGGGRGEKIFLQATIQ